MTKKIIASLFISLDGVVEEPGDWHFPYFNDEMGAAVDAGLRSTDTLLLGRKTYDDHAGAWPEREAAGGEDAEFAKVLGDMRKIVVSRQRLELTWRNSEQLEGDLVEAVTALKNQPGDGNIGMSGSVSVVRQLLAAGLLDELHLLVHPIAVRKGMRLFDEGESPIPLRLVSSEAFSTGVLNLVYEPAEPTAGTYEDAKAHLSQPGRSHQARVGGVVVADGRGGSRGSGHPGRLARPAPPQFPEAGQRALVERLEAPRRVAAEEALRPSVRRRLDPSGGGGGGGVHSLQSRGGVHVPRSVVGRRQRTGVVHGLVRNLFASCCVTVFAW